MKTVLVLACLVALASAGIPQFPSLTSVKTRSVTPETVERQRKLLAIFESLKQVNIYDEYYKIATDYDIKANTELYTKKGVVERFFKLYEKKFLPYYFVFSIFEEKQKEETMALFDLLYYAKDFDTFYKTAAWARVHLNEAMITYTLYVATIQRADTKDLAIPPYYELWPEFYANHNVFSQMFYAKARGLPFEEYPEYGIVKENSDYYYYANYSDYFTYGKDEFKMSYLTEDIGWNTFYFYYHAIMPFWLKGDNLIFNLFKERRGELYYFFYRQVLARYYLERLSNGLGEIPTFSWYKPFQYGYRPSLTTQYAPFAQRPENYIMQTEKNLDDLRFVRNYEDMFLSYLEQGKFEAFNQDIDFSKESSLNFVGNFWQTNPDLYEKYGKSHSHQSYERAARRILGGAPKKFNYKEYSFMPTALDFYQTSFRDPAFYQLYNKIIGFMMQYKEEYVKPYGYESLRFSGVKIRDVEVSKLETFFEFYPFNATKSMFYSNKEITSAETNSFVIVQPRLNHESFKVKLSLKSEYEGPATFKLFLGPKYDSYGKTIELKDNWMNFVELDWFTQDITKGDVTIERSSEQFVQTKDDSLNMGGIYELLKQNKLPVDMINHIDRLPRRLMLPRGTNGGLPLQIFAVVYPATELPEELQEVKSWLVDTYEFGYPLDRPITENFMQQNMYMKDVTIFHKGSEYPTTYNVQYDTKQ